MIIYIFGVAFMIMTIVLLVNVSRYHREQYAYRLGDIIKGYIPEHEPENVTWHIDKHPESIATKYIKQANIKSTKNYNDLDILTKIINQSEYLPYHNTDMSTLTIHLRTGDIIDEYTEFSIRDLLEKPTVQHAGNSYVKPRKYYETIIKQIEEHNKSESQKIKKIIFITGFHMPYGNQNNKRSIEYIAEVIKIFNDHNFKNIDVRIGNHPDNDFVFMSTSPNFARSGGGFSEIVNNLVIKNGGKSFDV